MSEHDDIERVLSRYRPAAPDVSLRGRVVAGDGNGRPKPSPVAWLAVAAALVIAIILRGQASRTFDDMSGPKAARAAQQRTAAIDDMTSVLGGGELARQAAEQWFEASLAVAVATQRASVESLWNQ